MSNPTDLSNLVRAMVESYRGDRRGQRINRRYTPSRDEIIEVLQLLLQLFYPGYFGRREVSDDDLEFHVGVLLSTLREKLTRQVELCLCHEDESDGTSVDLPRCHKHATGRVEAFMEELPNLRALLLKDVQAAFDGDPAARNLDEVIFAYPGLLAVSVYRVAHLLHTLGVPLMPRIMTEWAHAVTGCDIHPGAKVGESFFIDHATGVVVGETSNIGDHVKLYQGVTLGGTSLSRGTKRHPTLGKGVIVGANSQVLGGFTVGDGARIGSSAVVVKPVPAGATAVGNPARIIQSESDSLREAVAARMGFSAYGVTQGDDPVSQAMRSLIDNAAGHEHQIALLWAAIEKLAAQNRQLPLEPCVPQDAATQETFDAEGLRRKVN